MTIEDKAKAYDEALERARALNSGKDIDVEAGTTTCEYIFPELKESESERIRKDLIEWIKEFPDMIWRGHYKKDVLAWLEKQGEQKPYGQKKECEDCQFNYAGECKGYCALKRNECKPTDKVEPKFHEGDWVVYNNDICQIVKREEGCNKLITVFGIEKELVNERNLSTARLWTIEDAKRGDVLVDIYGNIGIFDKCYDFDWMSCCSLGNNGGFQYFTVEHENEKTYPATKEQRELLFQKMKEAGWEWNNEKKELKEIKAKTLDPDKVIEWLNDQACQGWIEDVEVDEFVDKFKKDF